MHLPSVDQHPGYIVETQLHPLAPKSPQNVKTMHISDLWEKKSNSENHEFEVFEVICSERYNYRIDTMTVGEKEK